MTLRSQIETLLEDYKKATGKGNMIVANNTLVQVIEALLSHIETHAHWPNFTMSNLTAAPQPAIAPAQHWNVNVPVQGWPPTAAVVTLPQGWQLTNPVFNTPTDFTRSLVSPQGKSITYSSTKEALQDGAAIGLNIEQEIVDALVKEGEREESNSNPSPPDATVKATKKAGRKPKTSVPSSNGVKRGRGRPKKIRNENG